MRKHNIFNLLNIESNERVISQLFVSILKEDNEYKKLFLKEINREGYLDHNNLTVIAEKTLFNRGHSKKYGRADIWIKDNNSAKRIIIENKIYADDQHNQMDRYYNYLNEEGAKREGELFYLTPQGKPVTHKGCKGSISFTPITYFQHIKDWLIAVFENAITKDKPDIKLLIEQYLEVLDKQNKIFDSVLRGDSNNHKDPIFSSFLELNFWNTLAEKIQDRFRDDTTNFISSRRKYSWNKILKHHKNNTIDKAYGIVFYNIRIRMVSTDNEEMCLRIVRGAFNEKGGWKTEETLEDLIKNKSGQCVDMKRISNIHEARELADLVFNIFLNYINPNVIEN